jgi:putative transposase
MIPNSIPTIVRAYKSAVTKQINLLRQTPGDPVWQRNYYEHIIGSEKDYNNIANYIYDNPLCWEKDDENQPA